MPLVTTKGFRPIPPGDATARAETVPVDTIKNGVIKLSADVEAETLRHRFGELRLIKIEFDSFSDGPRFLTGAEIAEFRIRWPSARQWACHFRSVPVCTGLRLQ